MESGDLTKDWKEMEELALAHFRRIFGKSQPVCREALNLVLDQQIRTISAKAEASIDLSLNLEELHSAALQMARNKVAGPDRIPVEFILTIWQQLGPLIHRIFTQGIEAGEFHPWLVAGLIILLAKKGDQRYLGNKRPLTLLNVIFKICSKAYQLRLTPILQDFINEQQHAFLLGRSIHRALLFLNEMLHCSKVAEKFFILLKLDSESF